MAYEQRDLSGSIFKNQKRTDPKHPNLTGSAKIDGREFWVSAWTKEDKNGEKWLSLSFKPKDEARPAAKPSANTRGANDEAFSDEIPF